MVTSQNCPFFQRRWEKIPKIYKINSLMFGLLTKSTYFWEAILEKELFARFSFSLDFVSLAGFSFDIFRQMGSISFIRILLRNVFNHLKHKILCYFAWCLIPCSLYFSVSCRIVNAVCQKRFLFISYLEFLAQYEIQHNL